MHEDPALTLQMASSASTDDFSCDSVLGLMHPHTLGHMYGTAVLALGGLGLAAVAHTALRRGDGWAWWSLLGFWLLGAAVDVYQLFWIYPMVSRWRRRRWTAGTASDGRPSPRGL